MKLERTLPVAVDLRLAGRVFDVTWAEAKVGAAVCGKPTILGRRRAYGWNVIEKTITLGSAWAYGRNVIEKTITLGWSWADERNVDDKPNTIGAAAVRWTYAIHTSGR
ncbi:hypothetical protein MKX42_29480 [Paenibacillus sp. FSL R7-0204]|uniref:hypothetical protein n=1 Tax=Paenibacillus sp. FSL R7-0204 TaxID=2921675 RepID=UPI0030F9DDD5